MFPVFVKGTALLRSLEEQLLSDVVKIFPALVDVAKG